MNNLLTNNHHTITNGPLLTLPTSQTIYTRLMTPADLQLVLAFRQRLTPESLYRRFRQDVSHCSEGFVRRAVTEGGLRTRITPLAERVVGPAAGSLWLLLAAAGLVMIASLANVTNLQLLRHEARLRELAVRRRSHYLG